MPDTLEALAVFSSRRQRKPPERCRAERSERALPDAALVGDRIMGMTGKRDGVGPVGEHFVGRAAVGLMPRPSSVASVLRMGVLGEEERFSAGEFCAVGVEKSAERLFVAPCRPVRADERISLHFLDEERRPRLAEDLLPDLWRVLGVIVLMVAGHENLDGTGIYRAENLLPAVGRLLQVRRASAVRQIAGDHYRIDFLVAEKGDDALEHVDRALTVVDFRRT